MATEPWYTWAFGSKSLDQQQREQTRQLERQRSTIDRKVDDLEQDIKDEMTHGRNALGRGNEAEARRRFDAVVKIRQRQAALTGSTNSLRDAETRMAMAGTAQTSVQAIESAGRSMEMANRRMPVQRTYQAAGLFQRNAHMLDEKQEITNEVLNFDDDNQDETVTNTKLEVEALFEASKREMANTLPAVSMTLPAAAAMPKLMAEMPLPDLAPLPADLRSRKK